MSISSSFLFSDCGSKCFKSRKYTFGVFNNERYLVKDEELNSFWYKYCSTISQTLEEYPDGFVQEGEDSIRALCGIVQRASNWTPLTLDLEMKYDFDPVEPYDDELIVAIIGTMQRIVCKLYAVQEIVDYSIDTVLSCVFSASSIGLKQLDNTVVYRLRFQFPYCVVNSSSVNSFRSELIRELAQSNLTQRLNLPSNWEKNFKIYSSGEIPLYGSSVRVDEPALIFENIYGVINAEQDPLDQDTVPPENFFNIYDCSLFHKGLLNLEMFDELDIYQMLPLFLSNDYSTFVVQSLRQTPSSPHQKQEEKVSFSENWEIIDDKTKEDFCTELLPYVSNARFLSRNSWREIGMALCNAFEASQQGLNIWISYTKSALKMSGESTPPHLSSDEFSIDQLCSFEYDQFLYPGFITYKTIVWFAKEDNPTVYKTWHKNWSDPYFNKALNGTDHDLAKALFCEIFLTHVCSPINDKTMLVYEFRRSRWDRIFGGFTIRNYISGPFRRKFEVYQNVVSTKILATTDEGLKRRYEYILKRIGCVIDKLSNSGKKSGVVREIKDMLIVENFEDAIDSNPNTTGHPNGVTEVSFKDASIQFRTGKPEDYICKVTGCRIKLDFDSNDHRLKRFDRWMETMFVDPETRHFVMKIFASFFVSGNFDKLNFVFTGDYNNGKSCISRLLFKTWGSYSIKAPYTLLTRAAGDSGSANSAEVRMRNIRNAQVDEPRHGESFSTDGWKKWSSNDINYMRGIYKEGGEGDNVGVITVFCNTPPAFHSPDKASIERGCFIPCRTTYGTENIPETEEEQRALRKYPMDKNFIHQITSLCQAFIYRCFQYFPVYCREGLKECYPPEIVEANRFYWKQNDVYCIYISSRLESPDDPNEYLEFDAVYSDFEVWYRRYYNRKELPSRNLVQTELSARFKGVEPRGGIWYNIRFKDSAEGTFRMGAGTAPPEENKRDNISGIKIELPQSRPVDSTFDMEKLLDMNNSVEEYANRNNKEIPELENEEVSNEEDKINALNGVSLLGSFQGQQYTELRTLSSQ